MHLNWIHVTNPVFFVYILVLSTQYSTLTLTYSTNNSTLVGLIQQCEYKYFESP